jgi:hypothetical protein
MIPRVEAVAPRAEKRVAILQSNYIPWKGYFDLIDSVDEFIIFDDAQYTRSDWRNRNKIKTPQGVQWLTIPVETKGKHFQAIKEAETSSNEWREKHLKAFLQNYAKADYFAEYKPWLEHLYGSCESQLISGINYHFMTAVCKELGITTTLTWSSDYEMVGGKTERLVNMCRQAGATSYLSGPAARDYIEPGLFEQAGITLLFMDYDGYPEYPQLYPPFYHAVTLLDVILNTGPDARTYLKRQAK